MSEYPKVIDLDGLKLTVQDADDEARWRSAPPPPVPVMNDVPVFEPDPVAEATPVPEPVEAPPAKTAKPAKKKEPK